MLLKQLVNCTISSYRWPNHSRHIWLNYQIAAVHYPQGSIKKNGTRTRKVSCNFELNSLDKRWHILYKQWAVLESRQRTSMNIRWNRACTIDFKFSLKQNLAALFLCLPDQLNPERLGSISDHHLPAAPQSLKWLMPRKSHRWSCMLTSDYHSGSNSTRKSYKMRNYEFGVQSWLCIAFFPQPFSHNIIVIINWSWSTIWFLLFLSFCSLAFMWKTRC